MAHVPRLNPFGAVATLRAACAGGSSAHHGSNRLALSAQTEQVEVVRIGQERRSRHRAAPELIAVDRVSAFFHHITVTAKTACS